METGLGKSIGGTFIISDYVFILISLTYTDLWLLLDQSDTGPRQGATLEVLRLRSCWELTNHGVLNIVHNLPALTEISLAGCTKITDDGVELLAENLRNLRVLDLSW